MEGNSTEVEEEFSGEEVGSTVGAERFLGEGEHSAMETFWVEEVRSTAGAERFLVEEEH